jgi:phosphoribosyl 1,2-cyclic phosphodiesterase
MNKAKVTFWGVRGSISSPGPETAKYGGNTPCVEISFGKTTIICDAGSGIRPLGLNFLKRPGVMKAAILFSHIHLDHVIGLPFFEPLYDKKNCFDLITPAYSGPALKNALTKLIGPPYFPVEILKAGAKMKFKSFSGKLFYVNKIKIEAFRCSHPDKSYAFKFYFPDGKTLVHASDNEPSITGHGSFLKWIRNVDVLIHDAQYSPGQYRRKKGWGHSPYTYPVKLASEANVGRLILFHYDPAATDKELDTIKKKMKKSVIKIDLSCEGMKIII